MFQKMIRDFFEKCLPFLKKQFYKLKIHAENLFYSNKLKKGDNFIKIKAALYRMKLYRATY